jgi:Methyltransferase domain
VVDNRQRRRHAMAFGMRKAQDDAMQHSNKDSDEDSDDEDDETIIRRKDDEKPVVVPPYGSKAYWEERYKKALAVTTATATTTATTTSQGKEKAKNHNDEDPDAFHNWYFSYDDLRPMLLPLVLGGRQAAQSMLGGDVESDNNDNDDDDDDDDDHQSKEREFHKPPRAGTCTSNVTEDNVTDDDLDKNLQSTKVPEDDEDDDDQPDQDDDGSEEASSNSNDESSSQQKEEDEEEDQVSQLESGLAVVANTPISVLEIGCGDAPLVLGLAKDMHQYQHHHNTNSKDKTLVINRIVGTDYSSTLIDVLQRMHHKKRKVCPQGDKEEDDNNNKDPLAFQIEFLEADARNLPFPNESFHLILEKGTMDAMISDPHVGLANCIQIVCDSARVLATGGEFCNIHRS